MELDQLEIGQAGPGLPGQRQSAAAALRRVGRASPEAGITPGGEDHSRAPVDRLPAADADDPVSVQDAARRPGCGPGRMTPRCSTTRASSALVSADRWRRRRAGCAADRGRPRGRGPGGPARRRTARRWRAGARDSRRPSATSTPTPSRSFRPAPTARVSAACSAGQSSGPTAAATPPCARGLEPAMSGPGGQQHGPAHPRSAAASAAESPAAPEPMTMRSFARSAAIFHLLALLRTAVRRGEPRPRQNRTVLYLYSKRVKYSQSYPWNGLSRRARSRDFDLIGAGASELPLTLPDRLHGGGDRQVQLWRR